jgi:hypothetical protein
MRYAGLAPAEKPIFLLISYGFSQTLEVKAAGYIERDFTETSTIWTLYNFSR